MIAANSTAVRSRICGYRSEVVFQVATLLIVATSILIALAVDPTPMRDAAFVIAMLIFGSATLLAFVLGRSDADWLLVVPILDMVALIVMRQLPEDHVHAIGYLAILPALWLGWSGRLSLAILAVVLSLGLVEFPEAHGELDLEHALRNFLAPAVVAATTASIHVAARRTRSTIRSLVSQEKTAADALQQQQRAAKLLDAIVDAVDTAVLAFDADGNQILANQRALHHPSIGDAGMTGRELEGAGFLFGPDRVTPVPPDDGVIGRALKGVEFADHVVWVGKPGGRQYAVSASARTLRDADGAFGGTVVAMNDVTSYLETIAAKDDFVASVSHELRTPLASIVGYLELIEDDGGVPESVRKHLSVIDRNTHRLRRLITDLLATASESEQEGALERRPCDLSELCLDVVDSFAKAAREAQVVVRLHAPEAAVAVVDRMRMRQAIGNLVGNSIKFSPCGEVDVTVAATSDRVVITVADSGVGVPADELEAIMSRFYRATTVREHFPGVGLGLSVTNAVVEAHNGTITVVSEHGHGTTVTVSLPAR